MLALQRLSLPAALQDVEMAEEEVGDSGSGSELCSAERSGGSWAPAAAEPLTRRARAASCPAELTCSYSSSNLAQLSPVEDEAEAGTPSTWSPALQASMAAWQSATSLLQELQLLQQQPPLVCAPAEQSSGATAPPSQLLMLQTPDLQQQHPAWLHSLLAVPPAAACEACSAERLLPPSGVGATMLQQSG